MKYLELYQVLYSSELDARVLLCTYKVCEVIPLLLPGIHTRHYQLSGTRYVYKQLRLQLDLFIKNVFANNSATVESTRYNNTRR